MKKLLLVLLVVGGLLVARLVLGLGLAWAHYRSAPTFAEWVAEHPADDAVWRAVAVQGEELATGLPWRAVREGSRPPERTGTWRPEVTIRHDTDILVDLALRVDYGSHQREDWTPENDRHSEVFDSVDVLVDRANVHPDFHGVAVLTFHGLQDCLAGERDRSPAAFLEVFALSGPGPLEVHIQDRDVGGPGQGDSLLGGGLSVQHAFLPMVLGLLHPTDSAPEEGLAYEARARFHADWSRSANGHGGAGLGYWEFGANSRQYSVAFATKHGTTSPFGSPDHESAAMTATFEAKYEWNGEVW